MYLPVLEAGEKQQKVWRKELKKTMKRLRQMERVKEQTNPTSREKCCCRKGRKMRVTRAVVG